MLQQLIERKNIVLPKSLGEHELLAKKFKALLVKKNRKRIGFNNSNEWSKIERFTYNYTVDFSVFYTERYEITYTKNSN